MREGQTGPGVAVGQNISHVLGGGVDAPHLGALLRATASAQSVVRAVEGGLQLRAVPEPVVAAKLMEGQVVEPVLDMVVQGPGALRVGVQEGLDEVVRAGET